MTRRWRRMLKKTILSLKSQSKSLAFTFALDGILTGLNLAESTSKKR